MEGEDLTGVFVITTLGYKFRTWNVGNDSDRVEPLSGESSDRRHGDKNAYIDVNSEEALLVDRIVLDASLEYMFAVLLARTLHGPSRRGTAATRVFEDQWCATTLRLRRNKTWSMTKRCLSRVDVGHLEQSGKRCGDRAEMAIGVRAAQCSGVNNPTTVVPISGESLDFTPNSITPFYNYRRPR